ncbi:MAG TPA: ABC transporter permease [Desulfuromonadaceae bacterium]|nr:ABC transporter permease [Desulfuromonadaceae bacterium]
MSKLPFELLLALRYLRPKRTFVSIITLISIVGVTLGVAVLIIVISVMSGFDHDLRNKLLGFNAHIRISAANSTLPNYRDIARTIETNKEVHGIAPTVLGQVLVETVPSDPNARDTLTAAPWLRGVDVHTEGSVSSLPSSLVIGETNLAAALNDRGVVVGTDFAQHLGLAVGDKISIYSPADIKKMRASNGKVTALPTDYTVTGIFNVGYFDFDANVIVTSLENAQDLYSLDDNVHALLVTLNDPYRAREVRQQIVQSLGPGFDGVTWMEDNSAILGALVVEKNMMFYLLFFIVLVAALCILSAQITFVVQKTREIGMLKALGATNLQISGIFLSQSAIIGVLGVLSGLGLGILAVTYRNEFLHFMNRMTGWELFPSSIYGFSELPAIIDRQDILIICGCSFVICILGGVLPAIRAGRLKPVEALRYE